MPEQKCDSCGRSASWCLAKTYWFADNDLWNEVSGGPNGVMCPPCFTLAAEIKGIAVGWRAGRVGEIEADRTALKAVWDDMRLMDKHHVPNEVLALVRDAIGHGLDKHDPAAFRREQNS